MKNIFILTTLSLIVLLSGCSSQGNQFLKEETAASIGMKIKENKTTKNELIKMFGTPLEKSFTDNGNEIWRYSLVKVKPDPMAYIPIVGALSSSSKGTKKDLTIMFINDIVKKYSISEGDFSIKTTLN